MGGRNQRGKSQKEKRHLTISQMSPRYRLDLFEENADNVVAEQDHLFNVRYVAGR